MLILREINVVVCLVEAKCRSVEEFTSEKCYLVCSGVGVLYAVEKIGKIKLK